MKLAEALVLRADAQKRLAQLRIRLNTSALVQEGEQPPEDPQELLTQLDQLLALLEDLIIKINQANVQFRLPNGTILMNALAHRDVLAQRYNSLSGMVDAASKRIDRYGQAEIRNVSTIHVATYRRQMDDVAKEQRELDTQIQATNWTVDLPD